MDTPLMVLYKTKKTVPHKSPLGGIFLTTIAIHKRKSMVL